MDLPTTIVTKQPISVEVDGETWKLAPATVADVNALVEYEKDPGVDLRVRDLFLLRACCLGADPEFKDERLHRLTQPAFRQLQAVAWRITFPPREGDDPKAEETDSAGPK